MTFDMVSGFFQELGFLALVSAVVSTIFAVLLKDRWLALFLSLGLSTLIVNVSQYLSLGGFDVPFVIQVLVVSTSVAILVISIAQSIRGPAEA